MDSDDIILAVIGHILHWPLNCRIVIDNSEASIPNDYDNVDDDGNDEKPKRNINCQLRLMY